MQAQTERTYSDVNPGAAAANDRGVHDIPALVDHIIERYHRTHMRELRHAISLARRVERLYAADPNCPIGLADHLTAMAADLNAHQWREETMLFPMLRIGTPHCLNFVTRRMMEDHIDTDLQIIRLRQLTRGFRPSFEAPFCWQALSALCRKLERDLREHARLENEIMYALLPS